MLKVLLIVYHHKSLKTGRTFYGYYFMGGIAVIKYAHKILPIKSPTNYFVSLK